MSPVINKVLRIIACFGIATLLFCTCLEFFRILKSPARGVFAFKLSPGFVSLLVFLALFFAGLLLYTGIIVALLFPKASDAARKLILRGRVRLKRLTWPAIALLALLPAIFLLYSSWGNVFSGPYVRLNIFLTTSLFIAVLVTPGEVELLPRTSFFFSLVLVSSVFFVASQLTTVTNFPFALGWSEGNRIYDYSLYLGRSRYLLTNDVTQLMQAPGRYLLWGIMFLFPNAPIGLHRLWDAILSTLPYLLFGFILARWTRLGKLAKWVFCLWIFIFLVQGPIYTPLVLGAILVALFVRPKHWIASLIALVIASYYVAASRWTWLPAPTAWAVLILLFEFEFDRTEKWIKTLIRLLPIAGLGIAGLLAGMLANSTLFSPKVLSNSTTFKQPLLWYRLFPNATYGEGILLGLAIATLPLIALLVWLTVRKRWPLHWLQQLACVIASLGFLAVGLVASTKIGGGNNLHNLDMFLITLAILTGLMLRGKTTLDSAHWPWLAQWLLVLTIFIPAGYILKSGVPLQLPPQDVVNETLSSLQKEIAKDQPKGDILFMDQRQLLTFGDIQNVPLVPEYEKNYMMDQAMAGNADYFKRFYQDLANKRFSLIITEPIFINEKQQADTFGEENNAWVNWVSKPLLCYYRPMKPLPDDKIQLLVPRLQPKDCPMAGLTP